MVKTRVPAATALIVNDNKVLLLKRTESSNTYKGYWQLPEGKVGITENPKEAIIRELKEEIDYSTSKLRFIKVFNSTVKASILPVPIVRHVFKVNGYPKSIQLSTEHSEYKWATHKEASKMKLVPGTLEIIESQLV